MLGRLATQIVNQGKQLKTGDALRLDIYTERIHRINQKILWMPFVFIVRYSPIGYKSCEELTKILEALFIKTLTWFHRWIFF